MAKNIFLFISFAFFSNSYSFSYHFCQLFGAGMNVWFLDRHQCLVAPSQGSSKVFCQLLSPIFVHMQPIKGSKKGLFKPCNMANFWLLSRKWHFLKVLASLESRWFVCSISCCISGIWMQLNWPQISWYLHHRNNYRFQKMFGTKECKYCVKKKIRRKGGANTE